MKKYFSKNKLILLAFFLFFTIIASKRFEVAAQSGLLEFNFANGQQYYISQNDLAILKSSYNVPSSQLSIEAQRIEVLFDLLTRNNKVTLKNASSKSWQDKLAILSLTPKQEIVFSYLEYSTTYNGKSVIKSTLGRVQASSGSTGIYTEIYNNATLFDYYRNDSSYKSYTDSELHSIVSEEILKYAKKAHITPAYDNEKNPYIVLKIYVNSPATTWQQAKTVESGLHTNEILKIDGYKYKYLGNGNVSFLDIYTKAKTIVIPDVVYYGSVPFKVVSIDRNASNGNKTAKKLVIGSNVISIEKKAFSNCNKLRKVTIRSSSISKIAKKAFANNKKITFYIPKNMKQRYKKLLKAAKLSDYKIK